MNTLTRPADNPASRETATPYFLRRAAVLEAVEAEKARRLGLTPA